MSVVLFQGEIHKVSTMADKTIRIEIDSAVEITDPLELAALFSLKANQVSVAIKEGAFTDKDVEAIPEPQQDETKTPSQRLRGTLYIWWKQKGGGGDFEAFYRTHMERVINQIKDKLT